MTLRVGLTGGIGSGKSTVANLFSGLGVPVIDADVITRRLVEPGQAALDEISKTLGEIFVSEKGGLDRKLLREAIFENDVARKKLEAILHPRVAKVIMKETAFCDSAYVIIVIPLLFEAAQDSLVDRVLVVDTPELMQIGRVVERDRIDADKVKNIMASQLDRDSRLARADDVISNDCDRSTLRETVIQLHEKYLQLAQRHHIV